VTGMCKYLIDYTRGITSFIMYPLKGEDILFKLMREQKIAIA
jgi:hypothetical protein